MLAANAKLDVRTRLLAAICRNLDQLTYTLDVKADERIAREDALVDILRQEPASIVATDAYGGLGQVVGTEREELAHFRNLACF